MLRTRCAMFPFSLTSSAPRMDPQTIDALPKLLFSGPPAPFIYIYIYTFIFLQCRPCPFLPSNASLSTICNICDKYPTSRVGSTPMAQPRSSISARTAGKDNNKEVAERVCADRICAGHCGPNVGPCPFVVRILENLFIYIAP